MTSSEALTLLQTDLVRQAGISPSESANTETRTFLLQALNEHSPVSGGNFALVDTVRDKELVVILAWERVCLHRASVFAPQGSTQQSSVTFNADRNTPFDKNVKLARELRARYNSLVAQYAEDDSDTATTKSGDITIGTIYKDGENFPAHVPLHAAPVLTPPVLTVLSQDPAVGALVFRVHALPSQYVSEFYVFLSTASDIYEPWNYEGGGNVPIPFARADAELIYRASDTRRTVCRIDSRMAGTYYAACAYTTTTGETIYSDEISLILAPVPAP